MGNSSRNIIEISFPEFEFVRTIVEDCSPSFQSGVAFLGSSWKRSEEHTSELQSLMRISYAVFCLKKKKKKDKKDTVSCNERDTECVTNHRGNSKIYVTQQWKRK